MRKRFALCVGINRYPLPASSLSGCINDAHDWHAVLLEKGYQVRTLLDGAATKANIVESLQEGLTRVGTGDRFVFSFSGHGTWVPDRDGDEADQRDEALCCYDYARGGLLTDDEMYRIFKNRPFGSRVTVLSDSCHSGTVSRLMADPGSARAVRFMPPSVFSDMSPGEAARREKTLEVSKPRSEALLLSGCADHEFSYDAIFHGRPNGAMSYFLIKALEDGLSSRVSAVYARLRKILPSSEYPQTPQLTATSYQKRTSLL